MNSRFSVLLLVWSAVLSLTFAALGEQAVPTAITARTSRLPPSRRLDATNRLHLTIGLPLRNPKQLEQLLGQISDPASPNFRRYLTPTQFTERFGPSEADYNAIAAFAQERHLNVAARHANRMLLNVEGAVADIEQAFHIKMWIYQHPYEPRTFYAPDTNPTADFPVSVLAVFGLDDFALPQPMFIHRPLAIGVPPGPTCGSGPDGLYAGADFRALYARDTTLTGAGQSLGLVALNGYDPNDIVQYEKITGTPHVPLTNILVDGYDGKASGRNQIEVCLDIEMAMSIAPGLSRIIVYEGNPRSDWHSILNRMADDYLALQLSCSWFNPLQGPDPLAEQIFQQMAAQGQSFFTASGDFGSLIGANMVPDVKVPFPLDSPHLTAVGGTTIATNCTASPNAETVWSGSSGGYSAVYPIPSWQTNIDMSVNMGSSTMRNLPDVAALADNIYVYAMGSGWTSGGTSAAAPLWAGFTALVNQQAESSWSPPVGFLNPALDAIGRGPLYHDCFHDITEGNNITGHSPNFFFATPGYDLCTGWGSPAGQRLITALATPNFLSIKPRDGFTAVGGVGGAFTITSKSFTLTNTGADFLDWSLASTSSWLAVSPPSGTLAPGADAPVSVSLGADAYVLPIGEYTSSVAFSNTAQGVAQVVPFTLQVVPTVPLTIVAPPGDQWVAIGNGATFVVAAGGTPPFTYQWQFQSTNIEGATNASLILGGVTLNQAGNYTVIVSNPSGSTNATAALIVVPFGQPPSITSQPQDAEVFQGGTAVFNVGATGLGPLTYQWYYDGVPLLDETNATLFVTNVRRTHAGFYYVDVSNPFGSVASTKAGLTIDGYSLGAAALWEGPGAGVDSVVLAVTPGNLSWTNTANSSWLHLTAPNQSGVGSTNIIFSFDANPGATRSGSLTIAGQALTVTQAGSSYVAAGILTILSSNQMYNPGGMAVDASGDVYWSAVNFAYHGPYGSCYVFKWSRVSNTVTPVLSTGMDVPEALAFDTAGNLYVTQVARNSIGKYAPGQRDLALILTGLNGPYGMAVDDAANVYIADTVSDTLYKWIPTRNDVQTLDRFRCGPMGLAVDVARNVYISDTACGAVKEWLVASSNVITLVAGLRSPWGITVDGSGNVYFAGRGDPTIKRWAPATRSVTTLVDGLGSPIGVAVDPIGNVYVADTVNKTVEELPRAFVDPSPRHETAAEGGDSLPQVLPPSQNLLPPFYPSSDQPWLTITGVTNGIVSFAFTENTGAVRTAHITLFGQSIAITQGTIGWPVQLVNAQMQSDGAFRFSFTNDPNASFTVLTATDLSLPIRDWKVAGPAVMSAPGQFQFISQPMPNDFTRFYAVRSP